MEIVSIRVENWKKEKLLVTHCFMQSDLDLQKQKLHSYIILKGLTHFIIHHFETITNSKKLKTTTEMWLLKDFKKQCLETFVEKGEIAHFEQFHFFSQCFP